MQHGIAPVSPQHISVITLGVADLSASRRFYCDGFGWHPAFETDEIIFFQMNGLVLGIWLQPRPEADMAQDPLSPRGAFSLAHNVWSRDAVDPLVDQLARHGGTVLRPADAPEHGGYRGYVGDPDSHAWEIAWNPAWPVDASGHVTFAVAPPCA